MNATREQTETQNDTGQNRDAVQMTTPTANNPMSFAAFCSSFCWKMLLDFWLLLAGTREPGSGNAWEQAIAVTQFIEGNGHDISKSIDPAFMCRLSAALKKKSSPDLEPLDLSSINADLRAALVDFDGAYTLFCNYHQFVSSPAVETQSASCFTLTYGLLIIEHPKARSGVDEKTARNEISVLRRLMGLLGHGENDNCSWMADEKSFRERLESCHVDDRSSRSALNKLRETVYAMVEAANPTNTLWDSYLRLCQRYMRSGKRTVIMAKNAFILHCFNATGISRKRLNARTILVREETYDRIAALETSLGGKDGELTRWLIKLGNNSIKKYQTGYSKRVGEAVKFRYALPLAEWPESLKTEWNDLVLLRTDPLKASRRWDLHFENLPKKKLYKWRIRKQDGSCPSATKQLQELQCFFGWCLLPRVLLPDGTINMWRSGPDHAIKKEQLSLGLVADLDLFDAYIAFRKAHTLTESSVKAGERGVFNRSCKVFIELTSSLLNPRTGIIYLKKDVYFRPDDASPSPANLASRVGTTFFNMELGKKVQVIDLDERWLYFCKEKRSYMEKTKENEFNHALQTRDKAPIAKILALDDPMLAIVELLVSLQDSEPSIDYWRHLHRRKLLFFFLMTVSPLRVMQFAFMSGGHLKKITDMDGRKPFYQIHFTKDEFKNERFIAEQDYLIDVPDDFTEFINDYLLKDWPAMNGRDFKDEDRIFATGTGELEQLPEPPTRKQLNKRIIAQLSKMCRQTTARHLGEKYSTPGFYPHAMRHITATSIIKCTGSYEKAALKLWDSVITVKKAYSHVKRQEQLAGAAAEAHERLKQMLSRLGKTPEKS